MAHREHGSWPRTKVGRHLVDQARGWRASFEHEFPVDAWDPLARLVRGVLGWDWLRLWLVAFLIYGPIEKLLLPYLGGYLQLGGAVHAWRPDVEALLNGFVEFPFFFAFYLWTGRGISEIFTSLARNNSFVSGERYALFAGRVRADFDRWQWTVLSLIAAVVAAAVMHAVVWAPDAAAPPWFGDGLYPRLLALVLIGAVAYAVAQAVVREVLAVKWLRRLWAELGDELVIRPFHPDGAGGLGAIGRHAVSLATFVLMLMLFILMGTLLPSLRQPDGPAFEFWSPLIAAVWLAYAAFVPAIYFLLIWPPHKAMARQRDQRLRAVSEEIDGQLRAAEASMRTSGEGQTLSPAVKRIEDLKAVLDTLRDGLPSWPVNQQVRRQLRLSTIVPVLYTALTLALEWLR